MRAVTRSKTEMECTYEIYSRYNTGNTLLSTLPGTPSSLEYIPPPSLLLLRLLLPFFLFSFLELPSFFTFVFNDVPETRETAKKAEASRTSRTNGRHVVSDSRKILISDAKLHRRNLFAQWTTLMYICIYLLPLSLSLPASSLPTFTMLLTCFFSLLTLLLALSIYPDM